MNINWKNKQRNTPLMIAIEYGGIDIVTSLLHAGADVTCINTLQEDALSLAAKRGNNKILEILLCSNHGKKNYGNLGSSNIPQRSSDKYLFPICPINVAARNGNLESIRLLVAYGISINSFNDCHFIHKGVKFYALTPLMIASIFGFSEIVEYFVSASGGNGQQLQINLTERNGLTALGCACLFGHIDCVNIIAKFYPDSLQFLHRYHDFESVPEAVVRNMSYLPKEDHPLSIHCLCQIISRGSPLSEKLIRRLTFRKDAINPLDKNLKVPCRWDLTLPSHDVVIFVSGEDALPCKTLCHSFILKAHSEVFSTMLSSTLSTKIDDFFQFQFAHISKQVFDLMLLWMYSGKDVTSTDNGTISPSLLVDLMIAANEFLILRLQRICEHRLCQCMEKKLLDDDSRAQLKELSVLLNLNHLLVYFTHERVQSPLQQHIIFQELQNLSIDGKDIMFPLKPELFPHLSYHPGTRTNTGCSIQYERELVRHILTRRIQEQNLLVTMKLKFESLLSLCLRNLSEINSFNLPSFLVDIYSISASEPGSEEVLATNYWERYLDCQPSSLSQSHTLPLLTKLFQTLFSSLFELCLCLEKYLKETAGIGRHHVEFHGFHQQFDYFTSLHDFISHEMYYLMIQHVVLSYSGYESYPSLGLLARDVIIRCDSDTLQRRIPISFINSIGKLDALYRLYTQQREEWNDIIVLEDICVHDLDTLLCYVYLGYIPIQGDERWNNIEKMTSISSYLANLLIIADEYLMDSFKHTVEQTLIRFLSPDNCATLFSIASTVNTLRLRDAAANMFLSNYHLYIQQETTNPSSISQSHHDQDNPSTRISLFFGESLAVSDFLQYVLSSLLE